MNWSRRPGPDGQVAALLRLSRGLPVTHKWSRGELEALPSGNPPNDLLHRDRGALGCGTAVDDDGKDGVLPQRGLPPAGIAEQIGLQAAAHAGGGVQGVLAVAVLHTAAERHLRQAALA